MVIKSAHSVKELYFVNQKEKDAFLFPFGTQKETHLDMIISRLLKRMEANVNNTPKGFECTSFLYDDEFEYLYEANPNFLKSMRKHC